MSMKGDWYRPVVLGGAITLGAFFVIALVIRRSGGSDETLSVVGGVMAYGFLAFALVVGVRAWRRRSRGARAAIQTFLAGHPKVIEEVGEPVRVNVPSEVARGLRKPGQANVRVELSGPGGSGDADLVMARLGHEWEVLTAALEVDGRRVALVGAPSEPS